MKKRVMGRPPAEWMYRVIKMKKTDNYYTFDELAERLETTMIAIKTFCIKRMIPGKYEKGVRGVQKLISLEAIKMEAEKTINGYFRES